MIDNEAKKNSKNEALNNEKISRLTLKFAATTLVALLLNSVYTLTDTLFISWGVGDNAMGGVSVVFPFVILQGAIAAALGGGAASIVSRKLGEGKYDEAGEITLNAMLTFYFSAIIITVSGFALMNPLLKLMGVTDDIYNYAKQYFIIILAGNIFSTGFSSIIRAEGKMLYGLLIWVIPISVNIILDAIFIFVLNWGVIGAAAATVICQFTSFCMSIIFFTRFTSQNFKGAKLSFKRICDIFAIGLPSLIQMGSLSIIFMLLNNLLRSIGGTLGVNTFAYMSKIITFAVVPFTAITQALAPIVGYNYGAGNIERVKETFVFCLLMSFIYALTAIILTETLPVYLMRIFTDNNEIINLGVKGLKITAVSLLFIPLPMLAGATFQAVGKKKEALIMYSANLVFLIPLAFFMTKYLNVNGIWWAYVAANALSTVLAFIKIMSTKKILA